MNKKQIKKIIIATLCFMITGFLFTGLFSQIVRAGECKVYDGTANSMVNAQEVSEALQKYNVPIPNPPEEHPRLFLTKKDIPAFKKKIENPKLANAWRLLLKNSTKDTDGLMSSPPEVIEDDYFDESISDCIQANAMLYLLNNDPAIGRKAIDITLNYLDSVRFVPTSSRNAGEVLFTGALVYDWCYGLLTEQEKQHLIGHFENLAGVFEVQYPPVAYSSIGLHSCESQIFKDLLSAGIAVYNEKPEMYKMVAGRLFKEMIPAFNYIYESGMPMAGDSYGSRHTYELIADKLFRAMGCGDVFSKDQSKVSYRFIYARRPDGQFLRSGDTFMDTYAFGTYWTTNVPVMGAALAASLYPDPHLQYDALRQYSVYPATDPLEMLLYLDPTLPSKSQDDNPLTRYFPGPGGSMIARTGWDTGMNSNAVVAEMKVGGYVQGDHMHYDAGSFQIYYKGALAIDSGIYQGSEGAWGCSSHFNYDMRTIAHNSLLVYDPDEVFTGFAGEILANDGGQRIPVTPDYEIIPNTLDEWKTPNWKNADVLAHQFGPDPVEPDFSYIKGDMTPAYSSNKVSEMLRSYVFLNLKDDAHPAAMVIYDKLVSKDPSFKKTWLLHSIEQPDIRSNIMTVTRTQKGYTGKLVNQTLLPVQNNLKIRKVGGPKKEFIVNGVNYPNEIETEGGNNCDESGAWRIEVSPKSNSNTDYFLNVMQVMDGSIVPMAAEKVEGDSMVGVKIAKSVVLFSKDSTQLTDVIQFTIDNGEKDLQFVITDLAKGVWKITKDGTPFYDNVKVMYRSVTDEGGVLYFKADGGKYTIIREDVDILPSSEAAHNSINDGYIPLDAIINIDGEDVNTIAKPVKAGNTIMVPMEDVFKTLGFDVVRDSTSAMTAVLGTQAVTVTAGDPCAISGVTPILKPVLLEKEAMVVNDNIMIPVSLISSCLGIYTHWDEEAGIITVDSTRALDSMPKRPLTPNELQIKNVLWSDDIGLGGFNTIDGDYSTFWCAQGDGQWIRYDLGSEKSVSSVSLAWYVGDTRQEKFDIRISSDGVDWAIVFSGYSSGTTAGLEQFSFDSAVNGRYVQILCHGNTTGWFNSLLEAYVY